MPQISVVIPTFNRAKLLKKAIESVLLQSLRDFELIIVDDGSTDETSKVISRIDGKIIYIKQDNLGPSSARNRGIKEAKGEFIAFLDSDDSWSKDKLSVQLAQMRNNPEYPISHTQEDWYKKDKLFKQKPKHAKSGGYIFNTCLRLCVVGMSTVLIREKLFDLVGLFDTTLPCCEDYDFWLRTSIKYPFLLINEPLTIKNGGRCDQLSSIYAQGMDKFRIKSIMNILKNVDLGEVQQDLAIAEFKKKCRIYGNGCIKYGKEKEGKYYLGIITKFRD